MTAQLDSIVAALGAAPDLEEALCIGDHVRFDNYEDPIVIAEAQELCSWCPVLDRCRDWMLSIPAYRRPFGVIGGEVRRPRKPRTKASA